MTGATWDVALDALEAWVRRTSEQFASRDLELPPEPPALPSGMVPAQHSLRARVLLDRLHSTESEGLRRRAELTRSQAYGA